MTKPPHLRSRRWGGLGYGLEPFSTLLGAGDEIQEVSGAHVAHQA